MEIKEDEIRRAAGHPDAIPRAYIEWFVKGANWMKERIKEEPKPFKIKDDTKHK